jgi:ubiquinone/menaquinone biosynthesis C-methylase UbiE
MTLFERLYSLISPLNHPLNQRVRRILLGLNPPRLLDVGGRRSTYTIGLREVVISDLPRAKSIQHDLDLGATDELRERVLTTRSNVSDYIYDDMVQTRLPDSSFDAVNATEVLEHVEQDETFVANVARVLKPGGHFVMTTPNGDYRPVPYRDHKRHYRLSELQALLRRHFREVVVFYCVNDGVLFKLGYKGGRCLGMVGYALANILESAGFGGEGPVGKHHLFAVCKK